ncbi:MAG: DUF1523 family protein [Polyangiaceae bacterium]|nr:DUF1523 family protein [Polyangiaceae bacterium]
MASPPRQTISDDTSKGESSKEAPPPRKGRGWKKTLLLWLLLLVGGCALLFFSYRWAGTSTYRGTIQRVYERQAEYRFEFATLDNQVLVIGNSDIDFPYVKFDSADLHAQLNQLARTSDIVDIQVWGFRQAWFSIFPNIIRVEFVRSKGQRLRDKAEQIADQVVALFMERNILKGGDGIREELLEAIERGLKEPEKAKTAPAQALEPKK